MKISILTLFTLSSKIILPFENVFAFGSKHFVYFLFSKTINVRYQGCHLLMAHVNQPRIGNLLKSHNCPIVRHKHSFMNLKPSTIDVLALTEILEQGMPWLWLLMLQIIVHVRILNWLTILCSLILNIVHCRGVL